MIKLAFGMTIGLLLGAALSAAVTPIAGMEGFSGHVSSIALGYACSMCIGATLGLFAGRRSGFRDRRTSAFTGSVTAALATYVLRSLPLPWLNFVWLDGTAGPAAELPLVVLPAVGVLLGGVFGAASRATERSE